MMKIFRFSGIIVLIIVFSIAAAIITFSKTNDNSELFSKSECILKDGKFYADNENINAYFIVQGNTIQLVADESDYINLYKSFQPNSSEFENECDNWVNRVKSEWISPISYDIYVLQFAGGKESTEIFFSINYDEHGNFVSGSGIPYVSEYIIEYCGVQFIFQE